MKNVIVIVGPTASGKTGISIELARNLNGEIISADSMQIYKFMNIGTAKASTEEMGGIKHYLIDEVNPNEEFSVARYQELAYKYIEDILSKDKIPIIAGGTGLYINSLIYNINFTETISDWEFRECMKKEAEEKGNQYLHDKLREVDPESADKLHVNDIKRVIRALEVYKFTKMPISYHQENSRQNPPKYNFILIGLNMNRQRLYERINRRVDCMVENGLIDEVKNLISMGYDSSTTAMQGLGYKEIISYLKGEITLDEAIYLIKRDSRHYAKRQMTWFKRMENIYWVDMDQFVNIYEIVGNIKNYIASSGIIL